MKKIQIVAIGLYFGVLSTLCACNASISEHKQSETETILAIEVSAAGTSTELTVAPNASEVPKYTESETKTTAGTVADDFSESEIAFVYVDNWGVVHNVWELSYQPESDPPYFYEYRMSGTPHQSVMESCPVSREEGDKLFALFKELDIINEPDETTREDIRITPSSVSFGYVGDDTIYHRYPTAEKYSAIMDELFKIGENAVPPATN